MASQTTIAAQPVIQATPGRATRLLSLDVFRGLTIAAMILVNDPGNPDAVYWPLEHAEWHGWTPTDLIFPFFLFIVGVSMMFSFARRRAVVASGCSTPARAKPARAGDPDSRPAPDRKKLFAHIAYRSAVIFAIGLFLNAFPFFHVHTARIPGVLQRIAVCYLVGAVLVLTTRRRTRALVLVALLIGYWALMRFVPVPGYGVGRLDPDGNLAAYLDRAIFGHHTWRPLWDPEGLLSTLPAIATVLFGSFAGERLQSLRSPQSKLLGLLAGGAVGLALGWALNPLFPINKNLWTSSYTIFTAGFACVLLGVCYALLDVRGPEHGTRQPPAWAKPFFVFGVNPILAYGASSLLTKTLVYSRIPVAGQRVPIYGYIFRTWFAPLATPQAASLLFAVVYVLFWLAVMWVFYAKRIFVKI